MPQSLEPRPCPILRDRVTDEPHCRNRNQLERIRDDETRVALITKRLNRLRCLVASSLQYLALAAAQIFDAFAEKAAQ